MQQVALVERALTFVSGLEAGGKEHAGLTAALGDLYLRTDRLAEAEAAYTKALAAFAAIDDRMGEANTTSCKRCIDPT